MLQTDNCLYRPYAGYMGESALEQVLCKSLGFLAGPIASVQCNFCTLSEQFRFSTLRILGMKRILLKKAMPLCGCLLLQLKAVWKRNSVLS
jgi:hypothetical protein